MGYITMTYGIEFREKAIALRKRGYSINELAEKLGVAKSSISLWVSGTALDDKAQLRLKERGMLGLYRTILTKKKNRQTVTEECERQAGELLQNINFDQSLARLLCSIFFWTEGGKYSDSFVYFTNSDPVMVKTFLRLLRKGFVIDERKLRGLVHIHEYHNDKKIRTEWSQVTSIPLTQFTKSYLKPHTKKRLREGYKGCISLRYYDSKIARELRAIYNVFARSL
jgi:transcriptional regulator with XRE-family HTH domain